MHGFNLNEKSRFQELASGMSQMDKSPATIRQYQISKLQNYWSRHHRF